MSATSAKLVLALSLAAQAIAAAAYLLPQR